LEYILELKPSIYFGGKYPNSPLRHRSSNTQTLSNLAAELGFQISDNPLEADIYLSLDFNLSDAKILSERKSLKKYNALFRNEPQCVLPGGYSSEVSDLNDFILTFGVVSSSKNSENWPQFWGDNAPIIDAAQRNTERVVMINANKLNLSPSELYTLRRRCVKKIKALDLFGDEWNSDLQKRIKVIAIEVLKNPVRNLLALPRHSKYWLTHWSNTLAPLEKEEVLKKYKVSLVIENEVSYVSEKLFDVLAAGCIPVYVGPDISGYGIPKSLVFEAEANVKSIQIAIERALRADYGKFMEELRQWFTKPETIDNHKGEIVMARALEKCVLNFNSYRN
jgi:hypothetical protein